MATLVRDGLELRYEVHGGSGPALLLPYVNFSWPEVLDLGPFTERFTVVTASPRGFASSERLAADVLYRGSDLADDLVAIMEAAGFERFSVLGYSFSGAFAPWLAERTGKVDAVVAGGFPIAGDYAYLYPEIQRQSESAKSDPAAWARVDATFDNRAALTFYRELSELPPDSLVADLPCPLFAFWGDQDEQWAPAAQSNSPPASTATGYNTSRFLATTTRACWPTSTKPSPACLPGSTSSSTHRARLGQCSGVTLNRRPVRRGCGRGGGVVRGC